MKKFLSVLTAAICMTACTFSLVACGDTTPEHSHAWSQTYEKNETHHWHNCTAGGCTITDNSQKNGYAPHDFTNGNCVCGKEKPVEEMKFDEFIAEHMNDAKNFVEDFIRDDVVQDKEVKSESWSISPTTENTKIGGVSILYTYDVNETDRAIELANVTLSSPISINKIVDGEVSKSDVTMSIDRKTVFEFDAKDNYDNQDITNALYAAENKTSDLKLIAETEASDKTLAAYNYLVAKNGKIDTYKLEVNKESGSKEDIIYNLENGKYDSTNTGSYSMNGTNIENVGYKYEEIESENPGPGPIDPDKPPVEVTVSNQEILDFLDKNVKMTAIKHLVENAGGDFSETNVDNVSWFVTKDGDNVASANLLFSYRLNDTLTAINLYNIDFVSKLSPQDIKDGKLGNLSYTKIYENAINPTFQEQHEKLADAIGDKLFGAKTDATRYIIDNGTDALDPKLGNAARYTVIEITYDGIKENSVNIAYANSDEGLINNLNNTSKYYISGIEKSVEIEGKDLTKTDTETTKTNRMTKESVKEYFGEEDSNDDDLTM